MKPLKAIELAAKINRAVLEPGFPQLSKIEIDLLKQHLRDLYEEIDSLEVKAVKDVEAEKTEIKPVDEEIIETRKPVFRANDNLLLKTKPVEEPVVEKPAVQPVQKAKVAGVIVTAEKKTEPDVAKTGSTQTVSINERIKSTGTLNERLKTGANGEIHKKLASKPLKELIDLNKRFVLLNELFKGNAEAFASAVSHIDSLPDYTAAQTYINTQLITSYQWDSTHQPVRMFHMLVKTRFGVE